MQTFALVAYLALSADPSNLEAFEISTGLDLVTCAVLADAGIDKIEIGDGSVFLLEKGVARLACRIESI